MRLFAIVILKASGVVLCSLDLLSDIAHLRDGPLPPGTVKLLKDFTQNRGFFTESKRGSFKIFLKGEESKWAGLEEKGSNVQSACSTWVQNGLNCDLFRVKRKIPNYINR